MTVPPLDISKYDFSTLDPSKVPKDILARILLLTRELDKRERGAGYTRLFPEEDFEWRGEKFFARYKYPKHLEFFEAGARYTERAFLAANRIGKTKGGAFEVAIHAGGAYHGDPKLYWWKGKRFDRNKPIRIWVCGKTNESTRDILQKELLGDICWVGNRKAVDGTGLIPRHLIGDVTWKQGVADFVDNVKIKHISGGWSTIGFKSYQQGRGAFEGTAQHVIWLDEEPEMAIYGECLIRTATTKGIIMCTFTPLEGMSEVVMQFLPQEFQTTG